MTYTFPAYVPILIAVVAAVAALVGIYCIKRRKSAKVATIAIAIAVLAGGVFAPAMARDRVVLDDEKLEQTTGFWFAPTVKGFALADVASITIEVRRGRRLDYEVWIVRYKDGTTETFDPGDLWEQNGKDIVRRLREVGIPVARRT